MISFVKMHAQGNDFVIIGDGVHPAPEITPELARAICARRFGIGCDQLLVLAPSNRADAAMTIFNADGSQAENCGNGVRCASLLLARQHAKNEIRLALADRTVISFVEGHRVRAHLGAAEIEQVTEDFVDLSLGNPHRVWFVPPPAEELEAPARNFEIIGGSSAHDIWIEILERGVGHTYACGSGASAAACAVWVRENDIRPLTVHMPGGSVKVQGSPENIELIGTAHFVYEGTFVPQVLLSST